MVRACRRPLPDAGPGTSAPTQAILDTLDRTDTTYGRQLREAEAAASAARAGRAAAERAAALAHREAERQAALAAASETARDSAAHYRLAYLGERDRGDSLQRALARSDSGQRAILGAYGDARERVRQQAEAIAGLRRDLRERTAQLAVAKKNTERNLLAGIALGVVADRLVPALVMRR